jgi:hypothetical protein
MNISFIPLHGCSHCLILVATFWKQLAILGGQQLICHHSGMRSEVADAGQR